MGSACVVCETDNLTILRHCELKGWLELKSEATCSLTVIAREGLTEAICRTKGLFRLRLAMTGIKKNIK